MPGATGVLPGRGGVKRGPDALQGSSGLGGHKMTWFQTEHCDSWKKIQKIMSERFTDPGLRWLFRGHQDAAWDLVPSLERVAGHQFQIPLKHHAYIEWRLRRNFARNLHRFTGRLPGLDDDAEWLALMQHHGAPTRMLDWTYSFYVALFFAIERAMPGTSCAVWAINQQWLLGAIGGNPSVRRALRIDPSLKAPAAIGTLMRAEPSIVVPLVPYYLNERLAVQQGAFLASMNLSRPFVENLRSVADPKALRENVLKLEIAVTVENQPYILAWLHRLNVNRLSLYPGIDGFASSLAAMVSWTRGSTADWRKRRAAEARGLRPLLRTSGSPARR